MMRQNSGEKGKNRYNTAMSCRLQGRNIREVRKMATMGKNMAAYRKKRNMSREALAEAMCMDPELIRDLETGRVEPTQETLEALSMILDVPPDTLLYGLTRGERRMQVLTTLVRLLIVLGLGALAWILSERFSGQETETAAYLLRLIRLAVYPLLALIAGKLLMKLIESISRAAEKSDDPGHTQDLGIYLFLILVLLILAAAVIPFLLLQAVGTFPSLAGRCPDALRTVAWMVTGNSLWNGVITGAENLFRSFPPAYLVFLVLGSGLWAARPRKRKKLKKNGRYSVPHS